MQLQKSQLTLAKEIELGQKYQQYNKKDMEDRIISQLQTCKLQQPAQSSINYQPDIDGLRTIAIVLVILYHAFPKFLPGGFIGVDVFFVISGYLISQILIKQNLKNKFSYLDFYSRRIRRIYPALILILVFVLIVLGLFYDVDQIGFSFQTLESSVLFGANIQILSHKKDYFDSDTITNPLLHLWSLGVQQQFYIVWPFLISIVFRLFKKKSLLILTIYAGFSFVFAIVAVYANQKFAFYFPICRFWQMAVGGILAYLNLSFKNIIVSNTLSFIGVTAILINAWVMNDENLFPGFWALIPTLGSACIIQARNKSIINKHILSSTPFIFVGKISFSLYLWHWPLLVFSRHFYPSGSTSILGNTYFIILLTVVLSVLTYYTIEDPLRKKKSKKIVIMLFILMIMVGVTSFFCNRWKVQLTQYDDQYASTFLKKAQEQMKPGVDDYVIKDGKKHPNLSKNKNRLMPTVQKTKVGKIDFQYDRTHQGQKMLQKPIDENSQYFNSSWSELVHYSVANQGKQNILLLVGDSHMMRLAYRFQQLHVQSVVNNKTDNFPSVVAMIRYGFETATYNYLLDYARDFIQKHKPRRLLIGSHWLVYWCKDFWKSMEDEANCEIDKVQMNVKDFIRYIKEIQSLGIQVSTFAIDLDHPKLNPKNMIDLNGVIEENIKPFRLSEFRNKYKQIISMYEQSLKKQNISIIDLSDNLCWNDICQVTTPNGYAPYTDAGHYGKLYARHWLSVLDHLVQF